MYILIQKHMQRIIFSKSCKKILLNIKNYWFLHQIYEITHSRHSNVPGTYKMENYIWIVCDLNSNYQKKKLSNLCIASITCCLKLEQTLMVLHYNDSKNKPMPFLTPFPHKSSNKEDSFSLFLSRASNMWWIRDMRFLFLF